MFPNFYYNMTFAVGNTGTTIEFVMIDTVILCGNSDHDFKHKQPQGPEKLSDAEQQWTWIEQRLKSSKYDFIDLCLHK